MKIFFLLSLFIIISHAYIHENYQELHPDFEQTFPTKHDQLEFENWALENNRHYDNEFTLKHRMHIFFQNKREVERFNRNHYEESKKLNTFSDLDKNEFRHLIFMHIELGDEEPFQSPLHLFDHERNPVFLDLQAKKKNQIFLPQSIGHQRYQYHQMKTPPVRNQGLCGSCWAFTGADVFASRASLTQKSIPLKTVSVSYIMDCLKDSTCDGCNGGLPGRAVKFLNTEGAVSEEDYRKYDEKVRICKKPSNVYGQNIFKQFISQDVPKIEQIESALQSGPLSIIIYANEDYWFQYGDGILDTCAYKKDSKVLHVAVLVGYDSQNWIFKNSWGTTWGVNGYFKVKKDFGSKNAQCNKIYRLFYAI